MGECKKSIFTTENLINRPYTCWSPTGINSTMRYSHTYKKTYVVKCCTDLINEGKVGAPSAVCNAAQSLSAIHAHVLGY